MDAFDYHSALDVLSTQCRLDLELRPVIGVELEAYLNPVGEDNPASVEMQDLLPELELELRTQGVKLYNVLQERGDNQLEIALKERDDISALLITIATAKDVMNMLARDHQLRCLTDAKPFRQLPGNGLHIHISMINAQGVNAFYKKNEQISAPLHYAIGGLMAALPESMPFFAPNAASYQRFTGEEPEAPNTVSWGGNNRTTALRLPDSTDGFRHLEHRVPGMDADPAAAIFAILAAAHYGITNKVDPPEQIFGNAFLPQYKLPLLPQSLEDAQRLMEQGSILSDYLA